MGDKKVVDLSRFFLFEEAADSEADFGAHDQWNYPLVLLAGNQEEEDDDDDDAESCICDGSLQESRGAQIDVSEEDQWVHETHSDCDDDDDGGGFNGIVHHHKMSAFEDEEEEKEGMISEVASTANSYSTRKCVQSSNNKSLSEIDKSRLFWEACLAS